MEHVSTEITDEQWDSVIAAHLRGHFVCCQEYVFHNPDRPGLILNLGAACGQIGRRNGANFCSAKGGIIALTKCLALELATLPMNRLGELEDVARMVQCIIDSEFTTGESFYVNGGQYMH